MRFYTARARAFLLAEKSESGSIYCRLPPKYVRLGCIKSGPNFSPPGGNCLLFLRSLAWLYVVVRKFAPDVITKANLK